MLRWVGIAVQMMGLLGGALGYLVSVLFCTYWWGLPGLVVSAIVFPIEVVFPVVYLAQAGFDWLFLLLCTHWTGVFVCALGGRVLELLADEKTAAGQ